MPTPAIVLSDTIARAWTNNADDDLYLASQELLDAGLYDQTCLDGIAARFAPVEGSALRMDALNIASYLDLNPTPSGLRAHRCMLFAIPIIGTPASITGFAYDAAQHQRLSTGISVAGLIETTSRVHILPGAWDAIGLVALHPQMLRNALQESLQRIRTQGYIGPNPLKAFTTLPALPSTLTRTIGAVAFALVVDSQDEEDYGAPDPLRFLLAEDPPEAMHSPEKAAVEDPMGTWTRVWKHSGPGAMLSCLMPVLAGSAAAAAVQIDCLSGLLDQGGTAREAFQTGIETTRNGGAIITFTQDPHHYHACITPDVFRAVGASLIDRFSPIPTDDAYTDIHPNPAPPTPIEATSAMAQAALASFGRNLCPPKGRLH